MDIDLSRYTKDELLFLHEKIRERLKLVMDMEALERISALKIGDIVPFQKDGCDVHSVVTRTNQKTVSVITEEGGKCRAFARNFNRLKGKFNSEVQFLQCYNWR